MESDVLSEVIKLWAPAMTEASKPLDQVGITGRAISIKDNTLRVQTSANSQDYIALAFAFSFCMHPNASRIEFQLRANESASGRRVWTSTEGWADIRDEGQLLHRADYGLAVRFGPSKILPKAAFFRKAKEGTDFSTEALRVRDLPRNKDDLSYTVDGFRWQEIRHRSETDTISMYFPPCGLRYDGIPILTTWDDTKAVVRHGIRMSPRNGWVIKDVTGPGYDYPAMVWPITGAIESIMMRHAISTGCSRAVKVAPPWAHDNHWTLAWQQCMVAAIQPWNPNTFQHGAEKTWIYTDRDTAVTCGLYHKVRTGGRDVYERYNSQSSAHDAAHVDWSQRLVVMKRFIDVHSPTGVENMHIKTRLRYDTGLGGPFSGPNFEGKGGGRNGK